MPTFHKPSLTSTPHSADIGTAVKIWSVVPGPPSAEDGGTASGTVIACLFNGKITLLVADAEADIWREVVGGAA
jgi:hypothetical protein